MKKIALVIFGFVFSAVLSGCGDTAEEKNQNQLLKDGFSLVNDIGEMQENGTSSEKMEEKSRNAVLDSFGKIRGENGEKLSEDDLNAIDDGLKSGGDFLKKVEEMSAEMKNLENGNESDEDMSMNMFGKIAEMQLKYDDDMTDEERTDAEAAAEVFKDGGKKFKEYGEMQAEQMKKDQKAAEIEMKKSMNAGRSKAITQNKPYPKIALIALDDSALAKTRPGIPKIGCNDVFVMQEISGPLSPKGVIEAMFVYKDFDEKEGYYNVFSGSKDLKVEELKVDENGVVTVEVSGELRTGGVCDAPRVTAQIKNTIVQFDPFSIKDVKILINGEDLGDYLSEK